VRGDRDTRPGVRCGVMPGDMRVFNKQRSVQRIAKGVDRGLRDARAPAEARLFSDVTYSAAECRAVSAPAVGSVWRRKNSA